MAKKKNASKAEKSPKQGGGITFILKSVGKKPPMIFMLILLLALGGYYFKDQFIVALVNNQPIWRYTLIRQLEKQSGKQIVDNLITKTLILQEANKQNISIAKEELDQEIQKIEGSLAAQGQNLDELLKMQGMTKVELVAQIKIQKIVEKIVGQDIEITDGEIAEYIEKNKALIPEDMAEEEVEENARQQLKQQKLSKKIEEWLQSLKEKAKIQHFLFSE